MLAINSICLSVSLYLDVKDTPCFYVVSLFVYLFLKVRLSSLDEAALAPGMAASHIIMNSHRMLVNRSAHYFQKELMGFNILIIRECESCILDITQVLQEPAVTDHLFQETVDWSYRSHYYELNHRPYSKKYEFVHISRSMNMSSSYSLSGANYSSHKDIPILRGNSGT